MLIFPVVVFPPVTPFTFQETFTLAAFWTVAVNCLVCRILTLAVAGDTVTETGPPAFTAIAYEFESCASGFVTVTGTELLIVDVDPVAVTCEAETKAVASVAPPSFTTAPLRNPLPFTVRLKFPVTIGFGVTDEIAGAGYRKVTFADPVTAGAATVVACTLTVEGFGTTNGAV